RRVELDRLVAVGDGTVIKALGPVRDGSQHVGDGIAGVEAEGHVEVVDGAIVAAHDDVQLGANVVVSGVVRPALDGLAVVSERTLVLSLTLIGACPVNIQAVILPGAANALRLDASVLPEIAKDARLISRDLV